MVSVLKALKKSMIPQLGFAIVFFISGIIVNFIQCILYLCLIHLNKRLYRKLNYYLTGTIHLHLVWLVDWWCCMDLNIFMDNDDFDNYVGKEHACYIMNHSYEIDWLIAMVVSDRFRVSGNFKAFIKKSLQYVPVFGWTWKFGECVFLERSIEKDERIIKKTIKEIVHNPYHIGLLLFPEGTRFTEEKHKASEEYARLKKLPKLKHHLQPHTQGFIASLAVMRGKVPAVYDIMIAFKEDQRAKSTVMNLLSGESTTVYIYINRLPLGDLPEDPKRFLQDIFIKKDKLQESFIQTGDFFATSGVPRVAPLKLKRRLNSMINFMVWAIVILCPMMYHLVVLLLSGKALYFGFAIGILLFFVGLIYIIVAIAKVNKGHSQQYQNKITNKMLLIKNNLK